MTADLLSNLAAALGAWSARLLDVSWQAGLVAAGAWLLCRLFPRMPAHVRAMLWWLVCAKFLVGLAWTQPVGVPLLPLRRARRGSTSASASASASGPGSGSAFGSASAFGVGGTRGVSAPSASSGAPAPFTDPAAWFSVHRRTARRRLYYSAPLALGVIWICGVLLHLALTYLAYRRTRALIRDIYAADASVATLAHALGQRIGVQPRRRPDQRVDRDAAAHRRVFPDRAAAVGGGTALPRRSGDDALPRTRTAPLTAPPRQIAAPYVQQFVAERHLQIGEGERFRRRRQQHDRENTP